jgi:transposase-like protein
MTKTSSKKPTKVYFVPVVRTVQVPHCPKCNSQVEEITDPDFRTLATYKCPKCNYKE